MLRRAVPLLLLALALLAPAVAGAAKPPAATIGQPTVRGVHIAQITPVAGQTSSLTGRVVVRVLVRHLGIPDAAAGLRTIGTTTVFLSRFEGDRNHSIAGGTASRALPVLTEPLGVIYQFAIGKRQSAAVKAAANAGALRALVLIDQWGKAQGHAPMRNGNFLQTDASVLSVPLPVPVAAPPLLAAGRTRVVIGIDAQSRSVSSAWRSRSRVGACCA